MRFEAVLAGFCLLAAIILFDRHNVVGAVGWLVAAGAGFELAGFKRRDR